ncbi:MAG: hypothetical protein ACREHV_01295 [Rhizomicrobium sp.]
MRDETTKPDIFGQRRKPFGPLRSKITHPIARRWLPGSVMAGPLSRPPMNTDASDGAPRDAIQREKSLKKYRRGWKINLIERENSHLSDLFMALAI